MTVHGPRRKSSRTFRDCILDCARDERMVAAYNKLYGTQLTAPIGGLIQHRQGEPGPDPDTPEGAQLARFIVYCYDIVWRRVGRAGHTTTRTR